MAVGIGLSGSEAHRLIEQHGNTNVRLLFIVYHVDNSVKTNNSGNDPLQSFQEFANFAGVAKAKVSFGLGMIPHVNCQAVREDGESRLIGSIITDKDWQGVSRKFREKALGCRTLAHNGAREQLPDLLPLQ